MQNILTQINFVSGHSYVLFLQDQEEFCSVFQLFYMKIRDSARIELTA